MEPTFNTQQLDNNNQALAIFNQLFEGKEVRIFGSYEDPLFVAKDICKILEIKNHRDHLANYESTELLKGVDIPDTLSNAGTSKVNMLTERGLYRILYLSRSSNAKKFRDFVFNILKDLRMRQYEGFNNYLESLYSQLSNLSKEIEKKRIEGHIYKITNTVDEHFYIGATIQPLNVRFSQHINMRQNSSKFYKHMKKIGSDNFKIEALETHLVFNERELKRDFEKPVIKKFLEEGNQFILNEKA